MSIVPQLLVDPEADRIVLQGAVGLAGGQTPDPLCWLSRYASSSSVNMLGRLTTPEAWLSTWSGLSTNADFVRCAPGVSVPTLFVELSGDQAAFPSDSHRMVAALGSEDLTHVRVRGTHFGGAITTGEPTGNELAAAEIGAWAGAAARAGSAGIPLIVPASSPPTRMKIRVEPDGRAVPLSP